MANRLFFINNTTDVAVAYDFSGTRIENAMGENDEDISLVAGSSQGGVTTTDRIYFIDFAGNARAYDFDGNRQSSDDITLGSGSWRGGVASNNRIYFINEATDTAVAYDFSGTRQSSDDISLGTGSWEGGVATTNRIYFINNLTATAVAYNFSGAIQDGNNGTTDESISLGTGNWSGGTASNNRIYFVNNNTDTAVAYDFSGTRQSSDDISLGTGAWNGAAASFASDATLTISTTDTHLYTGKVVDFDITSDIDISDFVASDITVTGGTRGTLTETDAQNFVLSVTLGAVGTLNFAIAEDAVTPGNTAVDEDFTIVAEPAAFLYFFDDTEAIVYGVSDANVSTRDTGNDRDFADLISGLDSGDDVRGAVATATRIGILDNTNKRIWVLDRDWNYIGAETVQLRSGIAYTSICAIADRWVVYNQSDGRLEFWDTSSRAEQTSERHAIVDAINGLFADEDYIYLVSNVHNRVDRRTHSSTTVSTFISSLGSMNWQSGTITPDRIILTETTGTDTAVFYNRSGTLQSSETITLPSGDYTASMALMDPATLTISTTETHLHTEKTFDIDITSDIDIDNFVIGDITVTGGTANSLTETDAQNWVLNVTAGSAGTMNVAIAQDVVSPSNIAADEDFTIEARATVTIAFADDDVDGGDSADATVTFSEAPTGLTTSDFSVNVGTVDSISGSGTTRTVTVTAPSTGTGTITLTLAEDSIEQGNAEASDTIDYAPPTEDLTVTISGTTDIEQSEQTTLTASVTNAEGHTITGGLSYAWTASRGSFPDGATGASVTYEADFTDSNDVDVDIECTVTRDANTSPTVSTGSLTAMAELGITNQILNMYIDETERTQVGSNTTIYSDSSSNSSLQAGSDDDVSSTIHIYRIRWHANNNRLIFDNDGTGHLANFFSSNTSDSIYLVFSDGTHHEITNSMYDNGGQNWARWVPTDSDTVSRLDNLSADDTLLIGVGDAGSIGYIAGSGTGTTQVTATVAAGTITATISTDDTDIRAGEAFDVDFTFSESVTGFVASDITVTGGTRGTLTGSGTDYTLSVTAGSAGTLTVSIAEDVVTEGNAAASEDFTVNALPTVTVTTTEAVIQPSEEFTVTFTWSESVSGFATGDVTVTNATKGTFSGSGDTYTLVLTAADSTGTITVTVAENAVTLGNAETQETFTISDLPTVTITSDDSDIREGDEFTVTFEWSENVTGFATGDVTVSGATKGAFSGSGDTYTLDLTAGSGAGTITVTVAEDAVTEENAETAETFTRSALPTVTITSGDSDIRVGEEFTVTFQWSENVSGFATGDVSVTGATKGTFSATDGDTYTLVLTASDTAGNIVVTVAEDAVTLGNAETSETFTNSALPTVDMTFSVSQVDNDSDVTVTFTWSESVSGFVTGDVTISTGTKGTFSGSGDTYTLVVTAPSSGDGDIEITVAEDAVTLGNAEYSESIAYGPATDVTIEAIDEVFIIIGTEDYELEVDITGNPTNVHVEGVYEGFSYNWDSTAGTVTIKIPEAKRLTMDQVWTVYADDVTREIIYNVVPAGPVITDPGDLIFFRGVKNRKFIQVSNNPDTVNVDGDLVGLTHTPGIDADGNNGVFISGEVDEDADFGKTDFQLTVDTSNENGDDDLDVDFDVHDTPQMFLGGYGGSTPESILLRVDADTANNTTADVFPFGVETGLTAPHITGMLIDGNNIKMLARPQSGTERIVLTTPKSIEELTLAAPSRNDDIASISADPRGIAAPVNSLRQNLADYYVVDGTSRRIHFINETNSGISQQGSSGLLPSNLTKPRGIFIDSNEDAYIVDLTTRRVNVVDEAGSGQNNITVSSGTINVKRYFILPTGCDVPGDIFVDADYVYVVDYADANENFFVDTGEYAGLQCRVFVMDKDTANGTTATATRVFSLPLNDYFWTQAIYLNFRD